MKKSEKPQETEKEIKRWDKFAYTEESVKGLHIIKKSNKDIGQTK